MSVENSNLANTSNKKSNLLVECNSIKNNLLYLSIGNIKGARTPFQLLVKPKEKRLQHSKEIMMLFISINRDPLR